MPDPPWLSFMFAGVMLAIAGYCAGRLVAAGAWRRESELDSDGVHLVMGVAMAGALAPRLSILTSGAWGMLFAVPAGWFAWQTIRVRRGHGAGRWRCPYPVPHLGESLAMVYMLAVTRAPGSGSAGAAMPGMGAASGLAAYPVLPVVLALFMVGYVAWLGDRLISVSRPAAAAAMREGAVDLARAPAAPGLAAGGAQATAASTSASAGDQDAGAACGPSHAPPAGRRWPVLAPRAAGCYKIAMGVTMAYMLIMMV
jgi:Domain of unknown function (DUF5134)